MSPLVLLSLPSNIRDIDKTNPKDTINLFFYNRLAPSISISNVAILLIIFLLGVPKIKSKVGYLHLTNGSDIWS